MTIHPQRYNIKTLSSLNPCCSFFSKHPPESEHILKEKVITPTILTNSIPTKKLYEHEYKHLFEHHKYKSPFEQYTPNNPIHLWGIAVDSNPQFWSMIIQPKPRVDPTGAISPFSRPRVWALRPLPAPRTTGARAQSDGVYQHRWWRTSLGSIFPHRRTLR